MNLLNILLQAANAADQVPKTFLQKYANILLIGALFVVFYFFLIRPQSKRQKEIQKQRDSLKTGDRVVTSGGIYGKIKELTEKTVILEIADNVKIKIDKASVFPSAEDAQTAVK